MTVHSKKGDLRLGRPSGAWLRLPAALLLVSFIVLAGCGPGTDRRAASGSGADTVAAADKPLTDTMAIQKNRQAAVEIKKLDQDSLIQVTVTAGDIPDAVSLQVEHAYQQVQVLIKAVHSDSLSVVMQVPDKERNLRMNQIVLPDGSMDGPFGHELHYHTRLRGNYIIRIGRDNMADGTVQGPVTLYLKLF